MKHIDENVVRKVLEFWMTQLHSDFNQHKDSLKYLKYFVRKALIVHLRHFLNGNEKQNYVPDVLDIVKSDSMNSITKNIRVPSLCGTDIADRVQI